ncbi:MAG: transporter substrate-binding domain-containing protein [Oscillospiraceae bacterium]|nr:transporter substrate-binding domain-containing protein [Oscillospiraceae bacterium]
MKRTLCILLLLAMCLSLAACGGSSREVKVVTTLVEQDYSVAFRTGDPTAFYVTAAIEVLNAEGKVDELTAKWFGARIVNFGRNAEALSRLDPPQPRTFIIGVDTDSFPMAYITEGRYWGFDVELATAVCERLGWDLQIQPIEKENVYIELSSGNIDCAWGGIALDQKQVDEGLLAQYGPYVHNDIVIATRGSTFIENKYMLANKTLAMCSTVEAMDALKTDSGIADRLGQISRLAGGTTECFQYLYQSKCDAILTDTTAIYYFNCH